MLPVLNTNDGFSARPSWRRRLTIAALALLAFGGGLWWSTRPKIDPRLVGTWKIGPDRGALDQEYFPTGSFQTEFRVDGTTEPDEARSDWRYEWQVVGNYLLLDGFDKTTDRGANWFSKRFEVASFSVRAWWHRHPTLSESVAADHVFEVLEISKDTIRLRNLNASGQYDEFVTLRRIRLGQELRK